MESSYYHALNEVTCVSMDEAAKKRRDIITRELIKMRERDENAILRQRAQKTEMKKLAMETLYAGKLKQGTPVSVLPNLTNSKRHGNKVMLALPSLKIASKPQFLPNIDKSLSLAANFWTCRPLQTTTLPETITRELTSDEIKDLHFVFHIFDYNNRGCITTEDLTKALSLLGFPARRGHIKDMIYETCGAKRDRISLKHFLQILIKLQNGGPDLVEEIAWFFRVLDQGGKGFVTFADLKATVDELKIGLSNKAIREMLAEADTNGDGKLSLQELTSILKRTETFIV